MHTYTHPYTCTHIHTHSYVFSHTCLSRLFLGNGRKTQPSQERKKCWYLLVFYFLFWECCEYFLKSCHSVVTWLPVFVWQQDCVPSWLIVLDKQEEENLTLLRCWLNFGLNTNDRFGHLYNIVFKHNMHWLSPHPLVSVVRVSVYFGWSGWYYIIYMNSFSIPGLVFSVFHVNFAICNITLYSLPHIHCVCTDNIALDSQTYTTITKLHICPPFS